MAVTLPDLKLHIGETGTDYDTVLAGHLLEAEALVTRYNVRKDDAGAWVPTTAPTEIVDRCVLEVAADLWNRRNAPHGIATTQFTGLEGGAAAPMRIARDPMATVYKILGRWVTPW